MGTDKLYHAGGCLVLTLALFQLFGWLSPVIVFIAVSLLKEAVWDLLFKKGSPDLYDVAANAVGCLTASAIIFLVEVFYGQSW